jgi:hypothetical protein
MTRPQAMTDTTDKPSQLLRTNGNDTGSVCKPTDFFNSLLVPLKRAIILETYTELLGILDDYSRRFGRGGKATKQGMLAVLSDPDVFGRFNADHQARIQAIVAGISFFAKKRLHRLHVSIRSEAGRFI